MVKITIISGLTTDSRNNRINNPARIVIFTIAHELVNEFQKNGHTFVGTKNPRTPSLQCQQKPRTGVYFLWHCNERRKVIPGIGHFENQCRGRIPEEG